MRPSEVPPCRWCAEVREMSGETSAMCFECEAEEYGPPGRRY